MLKTEIDEIEKLCTSSMSQGWVSLDIDVTLKLVAYVRSLEALVEKFTKEVGSYIEEDNIRHFENFTEDQIKCESIEYCDGCQLLDAYEDAIKGLKEVRG